MRSPLALLLTGALAVALVVSGVMVWRLVATPPASPAEVVVGESPGTVPVQPSDEDVVSPPPPVTGSGDDPASNAPGSEGESAPERDPAPDQEHVPDEGDRDDDQDDAEDDCQEDDEDDDEDCEEDDDDDD